MARPRPRRRGGLRPPRRLDRGDDLRRRAGGAPRGRGAAVERSRRVGGAPRRGDGLAAERVASGIPPRCPVLRAERGAPASASVVSVSKTRGQASAASACLGHSTPGARGTSPARGSPGRQRPAVGLQIQCPRHADGLRSRPRVLDTERSALTRALSRLQFAANDVPRGLLLRCPRHAASRRAHTACLGHSAFAAARRGAATPGTAASGEGRADHHGHLHQVLAGGRAVGGEQQLDRTPPHRLVR